MSCLLTSTDRQTHAVAHSSAKYAQLTRKPEKPFQKFPRKLHVEKVLNLISSSGNLKLNHNERMREKANQKLATCVSPLTVIGSCSLGYKQQESSSVWSVT